MALPSATFPVSELRKITAIQHYEERMLFTALFLADPARRLVYLTSLAVDDAIVDYYLRFLPDPEDARRRLRMVALGDAGPLPLTEKLLERREVVERVREMVGETGEAYILPFNVTAAEQRLSEALGLPMFGPAASLAQLGWKSGSRRVARLAGVRLPLGREGLFSLGDLEQAVRELRQQLGGSGAVVIKLNDGFSGQGNAIIDLETLSYPLTTSKTTFCGADESWPSFLAKLSASGAVMEELVRCEGLASPSAQMRISPAGAVEVVSTHDQILGGPDNQVYLGCRFPAHRSYRTSIREEAMKVARVLASEGVIGSFGIDFLVVPEAGSSRVYLCEINLRMGGTTHPFWMTCLATGGSYEPATGELLAEGRPKCYVATDNLKSASLVGLTPGDVIDRIDKSGLAYDPATATGATLHLLGAVPRYGKMGITCVADSPEDAEDLYRKAVDCIAHLSS